MENPSQIFSCGALFNKYTGKKVVIGNGEEDYGQYDEIIEADWCGGMGTFLPTKLIEEIGYFDQNIFPQYDGDTDFFLRAKGKGYRVLCYPELIIYNNEKNTGRRDGYSFANYIWWMTDIKSFMNVQTRFRLFRRHTHTYISYLYLLYLYTRFTIAYFYKLSIGRLF